MGQAVRDEGLDVTGVTETAVMEPLAGDISKKQRDRARRKSRREMRRAARIYSGRTGPLDKMFVLPDKFWWGCVGVGILLVGFSAGAGSVLALIS